MLQAVRAHACATDLAAITGQSPAHHEARPRLQAWTQARGRSGVSAQSRSERPYTLPLTRPLSPHVTPCRERVLLGRGSAPLLLALRRQGAAGRGGVRRLAAPQPQVPLRLHAVRQGGKRARYHAGTSVAHHMNRSHSQLTPYPSPPHTARRRVSRCGNIAGGRPERPRRLPPGCVEHGPEPLSPLRAREPRRGPIGRGDQAATRAAVVGGGVVLGRGAVKRGDGRRGGGGSALRRCRLGCSVGAAAASIGGSVEPIVRGPGWLCDFHSDLD
jgi:hypothetical protein